MSNLPPGITDSMCEGGPIQYCRNCGHSEEDHYEIVAIDARGELSACDVVVNSINKQRCYCHKFEEGEYEPDSEPWKEN